ncbi:CAP domain-containing protein [Rhodopirellula sp. JC639]|uniref:CAP domain-containing protein n=1 Tax=Stieleria mannarensis TaxID=2755585 RepID=UPI00336ADEF4
MTRVRNFTMEFVSAAAVLIIVAGSGHAVQAGWNPLKEVERRIQPPERINRRSKPNLSLPEAIHYFTNIERRRHGLPPFRRDQILASTAGGFARYMANTGRYGHNVDGRTPGQRLQANGYSTRRGWAENIDMLYQWQYQNLNVMQTAELHVRRWMDSPGHRANILNSSHTYMGVGVCPGNGAGYAVQMFGTD